MTNIYVGNLPFSTTNEELEQLFSQFGQVSKAQVIMDRETGRSRGFAFVEMADAGEAKAAIDALNGQDFKGRNLVVNEARPREQGGGGGFRGGRSSGGYGGGSGGGYARSGSAGYSNRRG